MRSPGWRTLVALLLAIALLASACGGKDDSASDEIDKGSSDFEAEEGLKPEIGGTVVYGVEAETDGFDPFTSRWAISGTMVASAIFDTLTKVDEKGEFRPWLAESVTPNEDYTVWTIKVRPNVVFHNGEALDGNAVKMTLDAFRESILTGTALSNIERVDLVDGDPLAVDVTMFEPWVPFPQYLTSQVGVVVAPSMFTDENAAREPVGTGPFVQEEWIPDNHWLGSKNPDYWFTDEDGVQLPYLDEIEFKPLPDPHSRSESFQSGDIDIIHTFSVDDIERFSEQAADGQVQAWESKDFGEEEEFLILFNNGQPPFDDKKAREAFVHAVDRKKIVETVFRDVFPVADGPFSEKSPWYCPPEEGMDPDSLYDPALAAQLVQEYKDEHDGTFEFTFGGPGIPEDLQSRQLTQSYLETAGITVNLDTFEFAQYVVNAVSGNYQANVWRQFGATDPDGEYVWWHPRNVKPIGQLSLNIARFSDDIIGEALDRQRGSDDVDVRKEAFCEIQQQFRKEFYLGWSAHAFWMVVASNTVHGVVNWSFPDGTKGMPLIGGSHSVTQIWVDQ